MSQSWVGLAIAANDLTGNLAAEPEVPLSRFAVLCDGLRAVALAGRRLNGHVRISRELTKARKSGVNHLDAMRDSGGRCEVVMSETSELRARASHYRAVAESADLINQRELLRIAADFEDEAARLDALSKSGSRSTGGKVGP